MARKHGKNEENSERMEALKRFEERERIAREESAAAKRGPGRPAGSRSTTAAPVYTTRPGCRLCGCDDLERHHISRDVPFRVLQNDGTMTARRCTVSVRCRKCGQRGILVEDYQREVLNDSAAPREAAAAR